ncbi:MAG: NAD(P)H-binding protein, partial [Pseudomonadales bacterium]
EGNRNIIKAMEDRGVNSLIKISGTSVLLPGESSPLMRRLLDIAFRVLLSNPTRCKYLEQEDILASSLDWIMVRPPAIVPKPVRGQFQAHENRHLGMKVWRDDLCNFMIDQIESDQWIKKCPVVGYGS